MAGMPGTGRGPPCMLTGLQSALSPAGPEGEAVAEMVWVLAAGAAAVLLVVVSLAVAAVFGRRRIGARGERMLLVGGGIVFPLVTLTALLVYSLVRGEAMRAPLEPGALRIEVIGEQWWWRARYFDAQGALQVETANEIRIPAGRPVVLELKSADVIHSFWVPALAGKLDMIPGRTNRLRLLASQTGEFRGQCAEYCGGPHALMAFFVVAEEEASFQAWLEQQQAPARQSHSVFVERCGACHTVRGTPAAGNLGPDLTHVASRRTIGAALLPRNEGTLAAWIASSQHLKPGNLMPSFATLEASELRELAQYLGTLE
jgi:cytochrome c oxidase subunit 2